MEEQFSGKLYFLLFVWIWNPILGVEEKIEALWIFKRKHIKKALMTEQKMEFETYQSWLWERCLISTHPHFFKYKLRLLGAKVNDGQSETRFVCLFIWCCLQNRICYVCTLISSMELFIVLKIWASFIDLMNFLNMPPSQETLHGYICTLSRIWNEAFIQNWCCCYHGKIFIHQPRRQHWESFQRVMTQYLCGTTENESWEKIWKKAFQKWLSVKHKWKWEPSCTSNYIVM